MVSFIRYLPSPPTTMVSIIPKKKGWKEERKRGRQRRKSAERKNVK